MFKLKNKKYLALLGIVFLIVGIIGLFAYGRIDKYKGQIKIKDVVSKTTSLSASINSVINQPNVCKGSDEIKYEIGYTMDSVDGVDTRDVIINAKISDDQGRYARFKEITDDNITSTLSNDGKEIEVNIEDAPLGVENNITLRLNINNAPNGFKVRPKITVREATGEESNVVVNEVEVVTNSIVGTVKDQKNLNVSNIELSLRDENGEVKRTYSDEDGRYVFSDIENKTYTVNVEEEIYAKESEEEVEGNLIIKVKEVTPYELEAHKYITKLDLVINGKEKHYTYKDLETVVEIVNNAKSISGEITYKIVIKNKGEKEGRLSKLVDKVDKGLSFNKDKNLGWKEKEGQLRYELVEGTSIKGKEEKEIGLRLDIKNTNEIKRYINEIDVNGETYERVVYILNGEKYREEDVILGEKLVEPVITDSSFSGWYTDKNFTNKYNFKNEVTKDLILYGKTDIIKHNVEFYDKNPETGVETKWDEKEVEDGKKVSRPENPSHTGYTFECWMDEQENIWNFNNPVERDLRLTSCYTINKYTVIFIDGNTEYNRQQVNYKGNINVPENPTKQYYTFEFWRLDGADSAYDLTTPVTENVTLYSKYQRNKHNISFVDKHPSTEEVVTREDVEVNEGEKVTPQVDPTKPGYDFKCWAKSNGTCYDFTKPVLEDEELTSKYTIIEYTITYNGLTNEEKESINNPTTYTVEDEITLNNPENRYDQDHDLSEIFVGWTGSNGNDPSVEVKITKGTTGDKTYKANWIDADPDVYPITYNLNNGHLDKDVSNPKSYTKKTDTFTLNNPSKDGYDFTGWSGTDLVGQNNLKVTIEKGSRGARSYEAFYSPKNYRIDYDNTCGEVQNPEDYTIETPTFTLNNPSKDGYEFTGWKTEDDETKVLNVTIPIGSMGNRKYIATCKPIEYNITYHLEGGNLKKGKTNPEKYTIESDPITLNNPSKDHYNFTGWTGTGLDSITDPVVIPTGSMGDREYTANYELITHNVTFNDYDVESSTPEETVTQFGEPATVTDGDQVSAPETNPTHTGYTCDKWSTKINGNYNSDAYDFSSKVTSDLTLYTLCKKNSYTVTYMDGDNQYAVGTVLYKEKATKPADDPTKNHHLFIGWTLNGTLFDFNTPITENITLYSTYEEVEKPSISHTPTEWTNQDVTVTITNKGTEGKDYTGYTYKYRIDEGEYVDYNKPFKVEENCIVHSVSYKNGVPSEEEDHVIDNIDKIKPVIDSLETTNLSANAFTINLTGHDNESGLHEFRIYKDNEYVTTVSYTSDLNAEKEEIYEFTNLEPLTVYKVKVIAVDVAGNTKESKEIEVETIEDDIVVAQITHYNGTKLNEYIPLSTLNKGITYNLDGINCNMGACTIQMLANVTETNDILEGQDITLDLNGFNINGKTDYTFNNNGDFVIIDTADEPGSIINNTDTGIVNTGNLTLGINDEELNISKIAPFIEGKNVGVSNTKTFNFYDGNVVATTAISGIVSNTPYSYNASVNEIIKDLKSLQSATLEQVEDPEARINSVYYTKLQNAVDDAETNAKYETKLQKTFMSVGTFNTIGDYGFKYDPDTNSYYSENYYPAASIRNTKGTGYVNIDLTGYEKDQELYLDLFLDRTDVNIDSYSDTATTSYNDFKVIVYKDSLDGEVVFDKTYNKYKSSIVKVPLEKDKQYYVKVIHEVADTSRCESTKLYINNMYIKDYELGFDYINNDISVFNSDSQYKFVYDSSSNTYTTNNDKNSSNVSTQGEFYIDLNNKEVNQDFYIDYSIMVENYIPKNAISSNKIDYSFKIYENDSNGELIEDYSSTLYGNLTNNFVLENGKKYYVLITFNTKSISSNTPTKMTINNFYYQDHESEELDIKNDLKTGNSTIYGFDYNEETHELKSNNNYRSNTTAFSYMELDLTNEDSDKEIIISASLEGLSSYTHGNVEIKENNDYGSSERAFIYMRGGNTTYYKIGPYVFNKTLAKGKKYYIQFYHFNEDYNVTKDSFQANDNENSFTIHSIRLVDKFKYEDLSNNYSDSEGVVNLETELLTNEGENGFTGSSYAPSNAGQNDGSFAHSYFKVDMTNETKPKYMRFSMYGNIQLSIINTDSPNYPTDLSKMSFNNEAGRTINDYYKYIYANLEPGRINYVHLISTSSGYNSFSLSKVQIIDGKMLDLSKFDSVSGKGFSEITGNVTYSGMYTNQTLNDGETADGYLEIDLTNETSDFVVIPNLYIKTSSTIKYMYVTRDKKDISFNELSTTRRNDAIIYYDYNNESSYRYYTNYTSKINDYYSYPFMLLKGSKYYLHFGMHKVGSSSDDCLLVKSVKLLPISNTTYKLGQIDAPTGSIESTTNDYVVNKKEDNSFRFIGKNPNNYILFNNEKWRIVGVFDTEDENENTDRRIKIVNNNGIGSISYDSSRSSNNNNGLGINEWSQADLMKLLNSGYEKENIGGSLYWNRKNGTCYAGTSNYSSQCDFRQSGIKNGTKSYIENALWHTAAVGEEKYEDYYEKERGTSTGKDGSSLSTNSSLDDVERTTSWIGKIALASQSDYALSVSDSSYVDSNDEEIILTRDLCMTSTDSSEKTNCLLYGSWLNDDSMGWSLNPADSGFLGYGTNPILAKKSVGYSYFVRPSLYLSDMVKITSGEGTSENPYTIKLGNTKNTDSKYGLEESDSFIKDGTTDNNYRYIGKNPNNYIYFNCDDYNNPNDKTCEKWRIIGVLKVDDGKGNKSRRLKIIRDKLDVSLSWDSSKQTTIGNGFNEWSQSDLMKTLNPGFEDNKDDLFVKSGYNSVYEKTDLVNNSLYWNRKDGICFNNNYNYYGTCEFSSNGLTEDAKKYIDTVKWYLGAVPYNNTDITPLGYYSYERGNKTGKTDIPKDTGTPIDDIERKHYWYGKVAVPYISDFLLAAGDGYSNTRQKCITSNSNIYGDCTSSNDWMNNGNMYTMSAMYGKNSNYNSDANGWMQSFALTSIQGAPTSVPWTVKPTLYLSTKTKITGGTGTEDDPYTIDLGLLKNTKKNYGLDEINEEEQEDDYSYEAGIDNYDDIKNISLYGFSYNEETGYYTNDNYGMDIEKSIANFTVDLTNSVEYKKLKLDVRYTTNNTSTYSYGAYLNVMKDYVRDINYTTSNSVGYDADKNYYNDTYREYSTSTSETFYYQLEAGHKYTFQFMSFPSNKLEFKVTSLIDNDQRIDFKTKTVLPAEEKDTYFYNTKLFTDDPDTVQILKNITMQDSLNISNQNKLVLDLNGYILSTSKEDYVIKNSGQLKIIDSKFDVIKDDLESKYEEEYNQAMEESRNYTMDSYNKNGLIAHINATGEENVYLKDLTNNYTVTPPGSYNYNYLATVDPIIDLDKFTIEYITERKYDISLERTVDLNNTMMTLSHGAYTSYRRFNLMFKLDNGNTLSINKTNLSAVEDHFQMSITFDGNAIKVYAYGKLIETQELPEGTNLDHTSISNLLIKYIPNTISSTRIYNRVLDEKEIVKNYNVDRKVLFNENPQKDDIDPTGIIGRVENNLSSTILNNEDGYLDISSGLITVNKQGKYNAVTNNGKFTMGDGGYIFTYQANNRGIYNSTTGDILDGSGTIDNNVIHSWGIYNNSTVDEKISGYTYNSRYIGTIDWNTADTSIEGGIFNATNMVTTYENMTFKNHYYSVDTSGKYSTSGFVINNNINYKVNIVNSKFIDFGITGNDFDLDNIDVYSQIGVSAIRFSGRNININNSNMNICKNLNNCSEDNLVRIDSTGELNINDSNLHTIISNKGKMIANNSIINGTIYNSADNSELNNLTFKGYIMSSKTLTINNGTYLASGKELNTRSVLDIDANTTIKGNAIIGGNDNYKAINIGSNAILTIGDNSDEVNTDYPAIISKYNTITSSSVNEIGKIKFYDGYIKGYNGRTLQSSINEVAANYDLSETIDGDTQIIYLNKNKYVAQIGETKYKSLLEAINSVQVSSQTTIKLIDDVISATNNIIPEGKNIIIDYNGHKIDSYNSNSLFTNNGTLKLLDSSETLNSGIVRGNSFIVNNGTMIIDNIAQGLESILSNKSEYYSKFIVNTGNLTVNNITIKQQYARDKRTDYTGKLVEDYVYKEPYNIFVNSGTLKVENYVTDVEGTLSLTEQDRMSNGISGSTIYNESTGVAEFNNALDTKVVGYNYGTLTFKDSNVTGEVLINNFNQLNYNNFNNSSASIYNYDNSKFDVDSVTTRLYTYCYNSSTVNINESELPISYSLLNIYDNASANLNNSTVSSIYDKSTNVVTVNKVKTKYIENDSSGTVNIIDSEISGSKIGIKNTSSGIINIGVKDGVVSNTSILIQGSTNGVNNSTTGKVNLYDGIIKGSTAINTKFNEIEKGYELVSEIIDGIENVYLSNDVKVFKNANTNVEYTSLKEAVDAASTGDTIIQIKNYVESQTVTIPENKEITINTDIYTLTINGVTGIVNNGKLTLKSNNSSRGFIYSGNGNFITNNGELINDTATITLNDASEDAPSKETNYVQDGILLDLQGSSHGSVSGEWTDKSGNHSGTIYGASWNNNGLVFDGTNDYVMIDQINPTYITVEVTFEINKYQSQFVIGNYEGGGYGIYVNASKQLVGGIYINGGYKEIKVSGIKLNTKYNVSLTYDGNNVNMYVNGVKQTPISVSGTVGAPTKNTYVALGTNPVRSEPYNQYFSGTLYSARIYERPLSEEEIINNRTIDDETYINPNGSGTGNYNGILNETSGTVTLNGGTITSNTSSTMIENSGSLIVNDGTYRKTLTGNAGLVINNTAYGLVEMNGGSMIYTDSNNKGTYTATGGNFGTVTNENMINVDNASGNVNNSGVLQGNKMSGLVRSSGTSTITNSSITLSVTSGTTTVEDTTFTAINSIDISGDGEVSLTNVSAKSIKISGASKLDLVSGTIHNTNTKLINGNTSAFIIDEDFIGTINIGTKDGNIDNDQIVISNSANNSTFTGAKDGNYILNFYDGKISGPTRFLLGANINELEEDSNFIYDNSNSIKTMYLSKEMTIKNLTTSKEYNNLSKAFAEANSNDELQLLSNHLIISRESTIQISNTDKYTLNLNGYDLYFMNNKVFENNGELIVTSTTQSRMADIFTEDLFVENNGTLVIENIICGFGNYDSQIILNNNIVNLNNVQFINKLINKGTSNINNSTIKAIIINDENATLNMTQDTISAYILENSGSVVINSSTMNNNSINNNNSLTINDTTYNTTIDNIQGSLEVNSSTAAGNTKLRKGTITIKNTDISDMYTDLEYGDVLFEDCTSTKLNSNILIKAVPRMNLPYVTEENLNESKLNVKVKGGNIMAGTTTYENTMASGEFDTLILEDAEIKAAKFDVQTFYDFDIKNCTLEDVTMSLKGKVLSVFSSTGGMWSDSESRNINIINSNIINNRSTIIDMFKLNNGIIFNIDEDSTLINNYGYVINDISKVTTGHKLPYVVLGKKDEEVKQKPILQGKDTAIYTNKSDFNINFYDGEIISNLAPYYGTIADTEEGYKIAIDPITVDDITTNHAKPKVKGTVEEVVTYNNINYPSLQAAINAVPSDGTEANLIIKVSIGLDEPLTVSEGKNIKIYLNGFTVTPEEYVINHEGTGSIEIVSGTPSGIGGAIYKFFANITGQEINPRNIIIYQMEDGTELNPETTYKLYKLLDNEYKLVKIIETNIGDYKLGNYDSILRTVNGQIKVKDIGEGSYKLVGSDGKELGFEITENNVSSNIRIDRYSSKANVTATAIATLIIQLQTGILRTPYVLIIITLLILIVIDYVLVQKKKKDYE